MKPRRRNLTNLLLAAGVWATVAVAPALGGGANVAATKHNLTASGPGTVKTTSNVEVCIFCHTPHAANPIAPLWNRNDPGSNYQTYESTTSKAQIDQPSGSSRLCLSCHDGTIALQQTYNSLNGLVSGTVYITPQDRGYIGTDLSDDHPISFDYDSTLAVANGQLHDPSAISHNLPLEQGQKVQCTTCHDPHDDSLGKFLRMDNRGSAMCISCHAMTGWPTSSHATATASLSGARSDNWNNLSVTNVKDAGCESCHRPHNAGGRHRLLRYEVEESNCVNCHDGSVAHTDIAHEQTKLSLHDVGAKVGVHDPTEKFTTMSSHVECVDCHDPHAMTAAGTANAPFIKPTMQGATGLTASGQVLAPAKNEYEVCYKCHSQQNFSTAVVDRVLGTNNIADEFSPVNQSFHPVEVPGKNTSVPSLLNPWTTSSLLYCTDCHGNNDASGPKGPHGSNFKPLLIANYVTGDNIMESPQAYDLCYKCHSRTSILADDGFPTHKLHIADKNTPCSVCHDPHGVQVNARLINFDRNSVRAASNGQGPTYTSTGNRHGSCTLSCHSSDHINKSY